MTLFEFQQLNASQQAQVICQYGVFVAERTVAGNRIYLYMVNYFYVELLHELSSLTSRGLVISRVFDDVKCLDDYLDKIPVLQLHD